MIARITVGSGSARTVVDLPRNRDTRRIVANKIKGFLFPTNASYQRAKARGQKAKAAFA